MSTIIKKRGKERTFATISENEVYESIAKGYYRFEPYNVCFRLAANFRKQKEQLQLKKFCGLVTLKVGNLPGKEEVERVMGMVCNLPHTMLAWRDKEGRTVYIVCRMAWKEGEAPTTKEEMQDYLTNAYKMLHYTYSTQLMMTIDTCQPHLDEELPYSHDPQAYFNPNCQPIFISHMEVNTMVREMAGPTPPFTCLPGMTEGETMSYIFHSCYTKAATEARKRSTNQEDCKEMTLTLLARYCHESALPMPYALSHAEWISDWNDRRTLMEQIFRSAYHEELQKKIPFGHISSSALLTLQTEAFLDTNYELRKNVLTGIVQYRERNGYRFYFQDLTEEAMNSMTIRALKAGLGSWDKDIRRLINSNDIRRFDPLSHYLGKLPAWDGTDRITPLAQRIQTSCQQFPYYLRIWLRSMVAHWMGKDALHGNAIVPLLIGDQGCGKTTFASLILPPSLRAYYNDKVDFRSEADLMSALSQFALINIDEFDSLKKSQQPTLKYLLSKSEVKVRPVYGKSIQQRRRYASFIATTNLVRPLQDRTGSRRFICVRITPGTRIDTYTAIEYDQLYAQILSEINKGERYWFDEEETQQIQQQNQAYLKVTDISEMIDYLFTPGYGEEGTWQTIDQLLQTLKQRFPYLSTSANTHKEFGKLLSEKGFEKRKTNQCNMYLVSTIVL